MRRVLLAAIASAAVVALAVQVTGGGEPPAEAARTSDLTPLQKRLMSSFALDDFRGADVARLAPSTPDQTRTAASGCPRNLGGNVRVNQDCQNLTDVDLAGRGEAQNETTVSHDPRHPERLVAAANDYRRGDSGCLTYYSSDGGRSWRDSTPPASFTRGAAFSDLPRKYWQAGGDPSVAWDTKGNAYLSCLLFDRGGALSQNPDQSSAFYVFRSTGSGGASWNFPGRPVAEFSDPAGEGTALLDKELIAVDDHRGSPFQDRVYVSWTFFAPDGTSYIYLAYSADYGEHFSAPVLVSGDSALCPLDFELPTPQGACNVNQFSQPFVGRDGAVYVTWSNFNVTGTGPRGEEDRVVAPDDNRAQILLARSDDGGATFGPPVKVGDYYDLPDCETYQGGAGGGSSCIPEKGPTANSYFRAANYPVGAVDPRDPDTVVVTFGSYINRHSQESNGCVPRGYNPDTFLPRYDGVKTLGACNNDIVVSRSDDGGRTFAGTMGDVRRLPAARDDDPRADQFFHWSDFDARGRLAVSFYDRAYGDDELTGFSDFSLSGSSDLRDFATVRLTTSSMPPPTQLAGAFFGDYTGLTVERRAHPVWVDTREPGLFACLDEAGAVATPPAVCTMPATNAPVANDQNIFTASVPVPVPRD